MVFAVISLSVLCVGFLFSFIAAFYESRRTHKMLAECYRRHAQDLDTFIKHELKENK